MEEEIEIIDKEKNSFQPYINEKYGTYIFLYLK